MIKAEWILQELSTIGIGRQLCAMTTIELEDFATKHNVTSITKIEKYDGKEYAKMYFTLVDALQLRDIIEYQAKQWSMNNATIANN